MTKLPTDINNEPIQALRLKATGGAHIIAATTSASAKNATAFAASTRLVSVYATQNMYLRFGGASASATSSDHFFPAGTYYDFAIGADGEAQYTYLAARAVSANGSVYISEKE